MNLLLIILPVLVSATGARVAARSVRAQVETQRPLLQKDERSHSRIIRSAKHISFPLGVLGVCCVALAFLKHSASTLFSATEGHGTQDGSTIGDSSGAQRKILFADLAGVAHEPNCPLNFGRTNIDTLREQCPNSMTWQGDTFFDGFKFTVFMDREGGGIGRNLFKITHKFSGHEDPMFDSSISIFLALTSYRHALNDWSAGT